MGIVYDAIDLSYLVLQTTEEKTSKKRVDSRSNYNKVHTERMLS